MNTLTYILTALAGGVATIACYYAYNAILRQYIKVNERKTEQIRSIVKDEVMKELQRLSK